MCEHVISRHPSRHVGLKVLKVLQRSDKNEGFNRQNGEFRAVFQCKSIGRDAPQLIFVYLRDHVTYSLSIAPSWCTSTPYTVVVVYNVP